MDPSRPVPRRRDPPAPCCRLASPASSCCPVMGRAGGPELSLRPIHNQLQNMRGHKYPLLPTTHHSRCWFSPAIMQLTAPGLVQIVQIIQQSPPYLPYLPDGAWVSDARLWVPLPACRTIFRPAWHAPSTERDDWLWCVSRTDMTPELAGGQPACISWTAHRRTGCHSGPDAS